ncbi:MAG: energy-coupling factor ABC transporter ATP-binding protein [Candidatus Thorarchaeota archaeon]|jgi:energy-coupling factor transport system ATP-binding protein
MILLEDVHYAYDSIYTALRGVSIQIDNGERVAIMGSNGAGKTTLIKHANGLLRPQRGRVFLDGEDTKHMSVAELARTVGLVWQNPDHQLFLDTVEKEVNFGLKNLGYSEEEVSVRCEKTLAHLDLGGLAYRSPFALSGGERKRVALASVLATEPQVLALDEPTIGQDAKQKERLAELLMELNSRGRTVVCVTHDVEFVIEHFPRTIAMADGLIIADGDTSSVLSNQDVVERCSLASPQMTQAARALNQIFPEVESRLTSMSDLEELVYQILEVG